MVMSFSIEILHLITKKKFTLVFPKQNIVWKTILFQKIVSKNDTKLSNKYWEVKQEKEIPILKREILKFKLTVKRKDKYCYL